MVPVRNTLHSYNFFFIAISLHISRRLKRYKSRTFDLLKDFVRVGFDFYYIIYRWNALSRYKNSVVFTYELPYVYLPDILLLYFCIDIYLLILDCHRHLD